MPLKKLVLSIIARKGTTLSTELRRQNQLYPTNKPISKPGYLKQRQKLNPDAILTLSDYHNTDLYKNNKPDLKTYKGYLVIADDGTNINLPTTKETLKQYGNSTTKHGTKPQASLGLSCCYDVLNKIILNTTINPYKFNEITQTKLHHQKIPTITDHIPTIITLDRAYSALSLFVPWIESNQKFIIRLKSKDFKTERAQMQTNDEQLVLKLTPARLAHYKNTPLYLHLAQIKTLVLRIVNIARKDGSVVSVATNLDAASFSAVEVAELYRLRWEVESAFDMLKNQLEVENFSGTKPVLIAQDVFACVFLCNLAWDMIFDAQAVYDAQKKVSKHRMVVNRGFAVGGLKDEFVGVLLEQDKVRKRERFLAMIEAIRGQVLPVRPDRHFPRNKGFFAGKYSNNRKRYY